MTGEPSQPGLLAEQVKNVRAAAALKLDEGPSPYASKDRVEGFRALAEKRKPRWRGR